MRYNMTDLTVTQNSTELSTSTIDEKFSQNLAVAVLSKNTRIAYESAAACYTRSGFTLPATKEDVIKYLVTATKWTRKKSGDSIEFTKTDTPLSPASLQTHLAALAYYNEVFGGTNLKADKDIKNTLKLIRRERGTAQKQAKPIMLPEIKDIAANKNIPLRDKALLVLGFVTACRRSELSNLNVSDLTFKKEGVEVLIRKSKTDQEGAGFTKYVAVGHKRFCPVQILKDYLEEREDSDKIHDHDALFLNKNGKRLIPKGVGRIVTKYFNDTTGHGLRAGFVSQAALAGIQVNRIAEQTGHKSLDMVNRYCRNARGLKDSPTNDLY